MAVAFAMVLVRISAKVGAYGWIVGCVRPPGLGFTPLAGLQHGLGSTPDCQPAGNASPHSPGSLSRLYQSCWLGCFVVSAQCTNSSVKTYPSVLSGLFDSNEPG